MQRSDAHQGKFALAWLALTATLCALLVAWGMQITSTFGPIAPHSAAASLPLATAAPNIVNDFTHGRTEASVLQCADPTSRSATATVQSTTGVIITTNQCFGVPSATSACIFSQSDDGMLVVTSKKTGSLLTPAQAANCTK